MANLYTYKGIRPTVAAGAFVAPSADIIGDVEIGTKSGIWFGCVLRGDVAQVRVGERTNIQDGTVIHVTRNGHPTIIGSGVTIGHQALLHACKLEDSCFVGMGATIMDDAIIESGGMVAAGALITPSKVVKKGQIWAGNPGKFFRDLTEEEAKFIKISEDNYVKHVEEYLSENKIIF
ncbi:MAG: gamma carbonic anhydrase family protein [Alphaproteobacteria bacterium CG11_big_fil_rev_8_21_14_0_20_39_49]|nr:MAG: gamma carbonic anhydrase family protein [Alphaproteobacteria bacterium CG11_big_fil_rev_8_21_14_0_20_39_49]